MRVSTLILAMIFLPVVACSTGSQPDLSAVRHVDFNKEFELRPGQQAVVGNELTIGFQSVNGDSRCPSDVTCIQEGNASVVLTVASDGRESQKLELQHLSQVFSNRACGTYSVELVQLIPYPRSDRPIAAQDYGVTLIVTR